MVGGTSGHEKKGLEEFRALFLQETIKRRTLGPSMVVS